MFPASPIPPVTRTRRFPHRVRKLSDAEQEFRFMSFARSEGLGREGRGSLTERGEVRGGRPASCREDEDSALGSRRAEKMRAYLPAGQWLTMCGFQSLTGIGEASEKKGVSSRTWELSSDAFEDQRTSDSSGAQFRVTGLYFG